MRWDLTEFLLKGIYLGLLCVTALHGPTWADVGVVAGCTVGGLLAALAWSATRRRGGESRGNLFGLLLFLLLENPQAVYAGVVGGLAVGTYLSIRATADPMLTFGPLAGGVALGVLMAKLRSLRDAKLRLGIGLALTAALAGGTAAALWNWPVSPEQTTMLGTLLLLGIPFFYLLTFVSLVEESEMEMAALCGAMGIGFWALGATSSPLARPLAFIAPLSVYFLYAQRVLPGLRVFKHALRGLSYRQVGQTDRALESLARALQLDPNYGLAREQLWDLLRQLDVAKFREHPALTKLVNFPLCVQRTADLLLGAPTPAARTEANHLLDLVQDQRPDLDPESWYWRAVAACHARDYDTAAKNLETLLLGEAPADPKVRRRVLFRGWQLALALHPEMRRRVGEPLAARPARRFEAIAAVERELANVPASHDAAWELKRVLYAPLTEAIYLDQAPEGKTLEGFDYAYARELGMALVDAPDQWRRGAEYLRIAARGLPTSAPSLYVAVARACEKQGDVDGLWRHFAEATRLGRQVGPAQIPAEERKPLFVAIKQLGDRAIAENRIDAALDAYKFFSQSEDAGLETYRTLAELFERKGEAWQALHCTEHALSYNAKDPNLLERKDRYYYSVAPADVKARWSDSVAKWFDLDYCRTKATWLLEKSAGNLDLLDWASHLADVYGTVLPSSMVGLVLRARVRRVRGEIPEASELLETVRRNKPAKFASEDEEDAWFLAHRLLGEFYLDTKPAEAVPCLLEFRKSTRAGADTMYKLGRAYENLGDLPKAARCYEEVTGFPDHPLFYDARDGLERVRRGGR